MSNWLAEKLTQQLKSREKRRMTDNDYAMWQENLLQYKETTKFPATKSEDCHQFNRYAEYSISCIIEGNLQRTWQSGSER